MKKVFKVILIIVLILAAVIASGVLYITSGLKTGMNVELSGIDVSKIADGTYDGTYKSGRWSNDLAVTVKDGKIVDIQIINDVKFSKKQSSDALFSSVISAQNTTVDAVSGATVTSKAYLKAIENALDNAA